MHFDVTAADADRLFVRCQEAQQAGAATAHHQRRRAVPEIHRVRPALCPHDRRLRVRARAAQDSETLQRQRSGHREVEDHRTPAAASCRQHPKQQQECQRGVRTCGQELDALVAAGRFSDRLLEAGADQWNKRGGPGGDRQTATSCGSQTPSVQTKRPVAVEFQPSRSTAGQSHRRRCRATQKCHLVFNF